MLVLTLLSTVGAPHVGFTCGVVDSFWKLRGVAFEVADGVAHPSQFRVQNLYFEQG